jgi:hypothetical protein
MESLTRKTGGNDSPEDGNIYPWPIIPDDDKHDIFCQIYKTDDKKFVDKDGCIQINDTKKTLDD